ncbi:MAG: PqqD family protein [Oscillospiraceae bacterium]|nr:PqqD family protein [Oscillospiraceae bacterium]
MVENKESPKWHTSEDFLLRRIAGEAVLVPIGDTPIGNGMITVNETFCFLWELFSEPITFEEAVQAAKKEYIDQAGEIEAHILSFLRDGTKYGMIFMEEN